MLFENINSEIFEHWWLLLGLGLSATIAQLALTKAYRVGNTLKNAGLSYLTILFFDAILGLIVFSETLDDFEFCWYFTDYHLRNFCFKKIRLWFK